MKSLHRFDANFKKIRSYKLDERLKDHSIYSIEFDHENNLWIALFTKGLIKIPESEWRDTKKTTLNYKTYLLDYNDSSSISGDQQWILYYSNDSMLWIGGVGGLDKYNYETDNFTRIFNPGTVKTIDVDSKGRIWAGTIGKGLYMYDLKNRIQKKYTVREGLINSFIYGIVIDDFNTMWITSEGGLTRFNISEESFKTYDLRDGLPNDHFDDKSESKLSDGNIYMGTNNGFIIFQPSEVRDDTSYCQIVLTNISINNAPLKFYETKKRSSQKRLPIDEVTRVELWPSEKDITFYFAALHYAAPHKIQYAYMLKGYDKQWLYTDASSRQAKYTNLDGGQYTFLVKATNSDGYWSKEPLGIDLVVHPPFYKTSVFIFFLIICLLLLVYLVFQ